MSLLYWMTASPIIFNAGGMKAAIFSAHSAIWSSVKPFAGFPQKSSPWRSDVIA